MREPGGGTEQSNPDGTSHSLKSTWRAGDAIPCFEQSHGSIRYTGLMVLAGMAVLVAYHVSTAADATQRRCSRQLKHIKPLYALLGSESHPYLVTPLVPLTPPQIPFLPNFPFQNALLFGGVHLMGITTVTLTQFLLISEPVRPPGDTIPDADDQSLTPSFPGKEGWHLQGQPFFQLCLIRPLGEQINL